MFAVNHKTFLGFQTASGLTDFTMRATGINCDPLSWWDALLLMPLIPFVRNLRGKPGAKPNPPGSGLTPQDRNAMKQGFNSFD